jgi:hypothetical protein
MKNVLRHVFKKEAAALEKLTTDRVEDESSIPLII